jgi:hypothetical protein
MRPSHPHPPHTTSPTPPALNARWSHKWSDALIAAWMISLWGALSLSLIDPTLGRTEIEMTAPLASPPRGSQLRVEGLIEGGRRVIATRESIESNLFRDPSAVILLTPSHPPRSAEEVCVGALVGPRVALLGAECAARVAPQGVMWGGRALARPDARVVSVSAHPSGFALALLSAPVFAPPLRPTSPSWDTPSGATLSEGVSGGRSALKGALEVAHARERDLLTLSTFVLQEGDPSPHRRALTVDRRDGQRAAQLALGAGQGAVGEAAITGGRGDLLGFISAQEARLLTPEVTGWARELGDRLTRELDALASAE